MRRQALDVIEAGIEAVLPKRLMKASVRFDQKSRMISICCDEFTVGNGRIFVVGGGKATGAMAEALETIIDPGQITAGIVSSKSAHSTLKKIGVLEAGHPEPDERGVDAVRRMLALKDDYDIGKNDLVICLISGGGSSLMPLPADGITLEDKKKITRLLLRSGAEIHEINTVRKHISGVKGGLLGKHFEPARVVSLIISDVIGDDLDVIASGPAIFDKSTFSDALSVLGKYNLIASTPRRIVDHIEAGIRGEISETPKELKGVRNYIIGRNMTALEAMKEKAVELGFKPVILTDSLSGDTEKAAVRICGEALGKKYRNYNAIISGGETTPSLPGKSGRGGRNQHFALVSLREMARYPDGWLVASIGTDGSDYLPETAGAIIDDGTMEHVKHLGLDLNSYIKGFDSNGFFKKIGGSLVETGTTGTNVGDVLLFMLKRPHTDDTL